MADIKISNLAKEGERRPFAAHGHGLLANAGAVSLLHGTFEPGWRWSTDVAPLAGTTSCQVHHLGYVLSGSMKVRLDDGTEREITSGDLFDLPPGHDAWVTGDVACEVLDVSPDATKYAVGRPKDIAEANDAAMKLVQKGYQAFSVGDMETMRSLFTRDVVQHVPGTGPLAGTYKGPDALIGYYGRLGELTDGTFRADLIEVHGDGHGHVVSVHQHSMVRNGVKRVSRGSILFSFVGDKMSDLLELHSDLPGDDAFFMSGPSSTTHRPARRPLRTTRSGGCSDRCCDAEDRLDGSIHVGFRGGPVRHGDAHEAAPSPGRATHPAGPLLLDGGDDPVGAVVVAEAHEDLVEHDVVDHLRAARCQRPRETSGQLTRALDQLGNAVAAELTETCPGREPAGPARGLQGQVGRPHRRTAGPDEVRRRVRHGRGVHLWMCAEREPAVVGKVQPLVPVAAPRVGSFQAVDEVSCRRACGRPQAERAVDVHPCAMPVCDVAAGGQVVAGARVHVAGLQAHDGRATGSVRQHLLEVIDVQRAVCVGPYRLHTGGAEAEQPQGSVDRGVPLDTGHDTDRRGAGQAVSLDVPARSCQDVVTAGGQAHRVRLLAAGHETDG